MGGWSGNRGATSLIWQHVQLKRAESYRMTQARFRKTAPTWFPEKGLPCETGKGAPGDAGDQIWKCDVGGGSGGDDGSEGERAGVSRGGRLCEYGGRI